jgi:DNA-binding NtrC family response regulator
MVTLAIERSGSAELTYQIGNDTISIGAASQNDIVIRSPGVAPRHLVIQRNGDVFTFLVERRQVVVLNGERRSRGVLRVGDRLRIGTAVVIFKGFESDEIEVDAPPPEQVVEQESPHSEAAPVGRAAGGRGRAELVLYSEPSRIAQARRKMVEIFRSGVQADLLPPLRAFFEAFFKERQIMLSWVDEQGHFQPIASVWSGEVPRLPVRTFDELGRGGRFAHLHLGARQVLIYPIDHGALQAPAFLVAETHAEAVNDDELIVAELARMLAIHWERVEQSGSLYGPWEIEARRTVEQRLPGTSHAIRVLRDGVLLAARSPHPVLLCGVPGSGRMTCGALIASLHPTGPLQVHVFQGRDADPSTLRGELFGAIEGDPLGGGLVGRARGGVLVARDVHRLPVSLQREMTAAIRYDVENGYGPSVRWMATTGEDALALVNEGLLDSELFNLFQKHLTRVPSLHERREDLPLLIVGLLDSLATEQGKRVRGIELETLNSLLLHPFAGEMAELVAEVRRLVSATPDSEMVRGRVPITAPTRAAGDEATEDLLSGADFLTLDDLKVVIPGIERIIIDRVLRRTKGNQSKAARVLNLSRGALIAKMKEYAIPDYRYLRRR